MIAIERIGHIVFTVRNIDATIDIYRRVLGTEPVTRQGARSARGALESVYFRDPGGNLIEIARYVNE